MAEEIILVGKFQDNISPQLKKLSKELDNVAKSFTKIQKKLRPITREMGNLAAASERVADALQKQKQAIDSNAKSWKAYQVAVGRAGAAQRKAFRGATRGGTAAPRAPRVGAPRGVAGGGGGFGASAVAGGVFGMTLSNTLQNAIVGGFRIGVQMMAKPFQAFGSAMMERIGDEMADIQSAGGMFAIDQKSKEGERLFKNFAQARGMQEQLNRSLARSAAALPGATNDYVRAARGLTDTVMAAFQKDRQDFTKLARELGASEGATAEESLTKVLTKFTEQTVLLGLGSSTGGMGLTMLMEQLATMDQVNITGMKRRYAQLRQNPLLATMLEEAQAEINSTVAGSADRFRVIIKTLQRALPEEVVNSMRMSASGLIEAIRSSFLDPDTGLFGLGRELKLAIPKINEFGQYVDENGNAVASAADAVKEQTTVFKIIRETLGGFILPLSELGGLLPELFDPLEGIANAFVELRETSVMVLQKFTAYTNWFKQQQFPDAPRRGALAAFNKLLLSIGAIDANEAKATARLLETKGSDLAGVAKNIITKLLGSDFMKSLGQTLGKAIGSLLASIATIMSGASDMATAGPFAEGFSAGFREVKGGEAIKTILRSVMDLIGKAIVNVFEAAPLTTTLVAGLLLFGPAIAAAVGTAILAAIPRMFRGGMNLAGTVGRRGLARAPGRARIAASTRGRQIATGPGPVGQSVRATGRVAEATGLTRVLKPLSRAMPQIGKVGPALGKLVRPFQAIGKRVPGLNVALAAVDFMGKKAEGKSTAEAAAGAGGGLAGSIIGGAIGTAIAPGIGTVIGSILGGLVGDWLGSKLPSMLSKAGTFFTETIPSWWNNLMSSLPGMLQAGWDRLVQVLTVDMPHALGLGIRQVWLFITQTLPEMIGNAWNSFITFVSETFNRVVNFVTSLPAKMAAAWQGFKDWLTNLPIAMQGMVDNFLAWASTLPDKILNALKSMGGGIVGGFRSWAENFLSGLRGESPVQLEARAKGGPVNAGQPYLVGERGPELFTPDTSGMITANNKLAMAGAGGANVTVGSINISGVNDPQAIANVVANEILTAINRATFTELDLT